MLLGTGAQAQLVKQEMLVIKGETLNESAKTTPHNLYLTEDMLVAHIGATDKEGRTIIFNDKDEVLLIVDHKKKEVTQITKDDLKAISSELDKATAEMQKQLAQLPAEQRAMVEKQMKLAMQPAETPEYKTDGKGQVSGWECQNYLNATGDQKESEICLATFEALGYDEDDFKILHKLSKFISPAMSTVNRIFPYYSGLFNPEINDYTNSLPVRAVRYNNQGQPESTTTIQSIEEEELDEAAFEVPKKYKKTALSGLIK